MHRLRRSRHREDVHVPRSGDRRGRQRPLPSAFAGADSFSFGGVA